MGVNEEIAGEAGAAEPRGSVEPQSAVAPQSADGPSPAVAWRRPARGANRWLRRAADVLLIAGGLVLAYPFWSAGFAQIQQSRLSTDYLHSSASFAAVAAASGDTRTHGVPAAEVVRRLAVLYQGQLKPGDPIGRLKIPRIHLNRLIQQGVGGRAGLDPSGDRSLLRNGPVHYGITPLPGEGRPFAIAGHRTTYGAPFYSLDKLRPGDRITMDTPYARFRYVVDKTTVVLPSAIGVLRDRGYALVLTTCTPLYSASHRLVVWASLVSATPL